MPYSRLDWIRLGCFPGLSYRNKRILLDLAGGDPGRALGGGLKLASESQADNALLKAWRKGAAEAPYTDDLRWLERDNRRVIGLGEADYPALLSEIPDPPITLFVVGDAALLDTATVAVVGSRRASVDGIRNARRFATEFAQAGLGIVSGLAHGIDAEAHRAALDSGAATVAVMATGPDRLYPRQHAELARSIANAGVLLTEFPCGTGPRRSHFARRNRLISGLSLGTVVIEAAQRSGSLITARLAGEQGRDVFALPGPAGVAGSQGCHNLIRQGALLVDSPEDVVSALGWQRRGHGRAAGPSNELNGTIESAIADKNSILGTDVTSSRSERAVLNQVGYTPATVDELVERSGLTAAEVCSIVLALELSGLLVNQGGRYRLS